jgi:HK97 family phage portal protein
MPNEFVVDRPGALAALGRAMKTITRNIPYSGGTYYGRGSAFGGGLAGWNGAINYATQAGAKFDYDEAAGNLLDNSTVAVCVDRVAQAVNEAPPILQKKNSAGAWETAGDHDCIALLNKPMQNENGYGGVHLWGATAAFECVHGEAKWILEFTRGGAPAEIRIEDPTRVVPYGDPDNFIKGYKFWPVGGAPLELDQRQVVHFRHALNHNDTRVGWGPMQTGKRQVAGDNAVSSYHAALLRNNAMASMLVSFKEQVSSNDVTPDQFQAWIAQFRRHFSGEGIGGVAGMNLPLEVHKLGYSPDEMALDKLVSYYETKICALIGVDPMVAGLGSGTEHRTYANMGEAINDFWERRIKPTKNRYTSELGAQYLPLWDLDPNEYRIGWDYSDVGALQENEQQLYGQMNEAYKAGWLKKSEARARVGLEVTPEDDVYFGGSAAEADDRKSKEVPPVVAGDDPADGEMDEALDEHLSSVHLTAPVTAVLRDETKALTAEVLTAEHGMPAPLPDPHGVAFTDEELAALTDTDNEEAVKRAYVKSTPEKRALLRAEPINQDA